MHNFYISGEISESTFDAFQMFWQDIKDKTSDKSIRVYINSNGGCMISTLRIAQQLLDLLKKGYIIHTFGQKQVASGALIIFLCGTKGNRVLARETKLLFHRGSKKVNLNFDLKEDTKIKEVVELNKMIETQKNIITKNKFVIDFIIKRTNITKELFYKKEDTYFNAEKAIEIGVADTIEDTLLTMQELEKFVRTFIDTKKIPFKIPSKISSKLNDHLTNYFEVLTRIELIGMCMITIMDNTDVISLHDIENCKY